MKNVIIRKILVAGILTLLIIMYTPNIFASKINTMDSKTLLEEVGFYRFGIIIGSIKSKNYDQDVLELVAGHGPRFDFRFSTLFNSKRLVQNQHVRLTNYNRCFFINDFVVGFCKIYMPKAEISMHIVSHNEQENEVIWEIDEIMGDKIWENNMRPSVYTESGEITSCLFGPTYNEYLSVGDQIRINTDEDGYFRIVIKEVVSNDVLFESTLVKF
ncbi:hypothetical protein AYK24_07040 [Thermoplasmatales archaeon SG8-52-4]|nr:MAG: hypothetical protein AYK24_07040 [Thermoplasmatales archaeon SG8-52-4]